MKRLLLLACTFISLSTISQAQITKGSVLMGGSIGVNKSKGESDQVEIKSNSFYVSPSIGVAVKDNWILGVQAGFSRGRYQQENSNYISDMDGYSAGVFGRRYMPLSSHFYLYGQVDLSYGQEKREQGYPDGNLAKIENKGFDLGLTPGITYAVSKRFHLEAYLNNLVSLGYTDNTSESISFAGRTTSESKNFYFSTNLSSSVPLSVGFRILLGK